eukprot:m51a1_g12399 hypothetical protein (115) ;mRNA; r:683911-684340
MSDSDTTPTGDYSTTPEDVAEEEEREMTGERVCMDVDEEESEMAVGRASGVRADDPAPESPEECLEEQFFKEAEAKIDAEIDAEIAAHIRNLDTPYSQRKSMPVRVQGSKCSDV